MLLRILIGVILQAGNAHVQNITERMPMDKRCDSRKILINFPQGSFPCGWYISGELLREITEEMMSIVRDTAGAPPKTINVYGFEERPGLRTMLILQADREKILRAIKSVLPGCDVVWC